MSGQDQKPAHRGWTIAGTVATILAAVVAVIALAGTQGGSRPPVPVDAAPTSEEPTPVIVPEVTVPAAVATATQEAPAPAAPQTMFLMNLDGDSVVRRPHWVFPDDGPTTINGIEYASSVMYQFQNCSSCTETLEVLVPPGYTRLTGVFGLSDKSRHDDVIDGVVYFAVYDASGNQIVPKQRIEYPESIAVDVDVSGTPRISIEMSEGTNAEQFALGDAAFHQP